MLVRIEVSAERSPACPSVSPDAEQFGVSKSERAPVGAADDGCRHQAYIR